MQTHAFGIDTGIRPQIKPKVRGPNGAAPPPD